MDDALADALASVPADASARPEAQLSRDELLVRVREALDALPANYSSALEWKYIEGCSVAEIGERLGLNAIATQSLLARARQGLKALLERAGPQGLDDLLPFARRVKP